LESDLKKFLMNTEYVDFWEPAVQAKARELFPDQMNDIQKTETAFLFVRDEVKHSFDIEAAVITSKASDVLKYKTGICHAKSNLLAALLRSQGIPAGFRFEYLRFGKENARGFCIHAFNAVLLNHEWIEMDARGNKAGVDAQFSMTEKQLAFLPREEYGEFFIDGIYAEPDLVTMKILNQANSLQDVREELRMSTEQSRSMLGSRSEGEVVWRER